MAQFLLYVISRLTGNLSPQTETDQMDVVVVYRSTVHQIIDEMCQTFAGQW